MDMDIFAPSDEVSLSTVDPISTYATIEIIEEIVDRLLTHQIWEYYESKLIDNDNQFATLKLNYENLKTFRKELEYGQISQGLKLCFLETIQEVANGKRVDASMKLEKLESLL